MDQIRCFQFLTGGTLTQVNLHLPPPLQPKNSGDAYGLRAKQARFCKFQRSCAWLIFIFICRLVVYKLQGQGRRIRGFEGARAPPEHTSAPSHPQKHPLEIKEKVHKTPCNTKIQRKYKHFTLNLGKSMKIITILHHDALNQTVTSRKAPPGVSIILHPCAGMRLRKFSWGGGGRDVTS